MNKDINSPSSLITHPAKDVENQKVAHSRDWVDESVRSFNFATGDPNIETREWYKTACQYAATLQAQDERPKILSF